MKYCLKQVINYQINNKIITLSVSVVVIECIQKMLIITAVTHSPIDLKERKIV